MTTEEKLDLLETKLEYCVEHEEYERAARLRDEIAELKKLQNA
jgi:protein-arginine kinase activator protein McsA